jgi:hypothetical protein
MNEYFVNGHVSKTKNDNDTLNITHGIAGCFSCCSIKLHDIVIYTYLFRKLPEYLNCEQQFSYYKSADILQKNEKELVEKNTKHFNIDIGNDYYTDITQNLFKYDSNSIINESCIFDFNHQFTGYKNLDYLHINPFIKKYFSLSDKVSENMAFLMDKYKLEPLKTCAVFYRGNDKQLEINKPSYIELVNKAKDIKKMYPDIQFLVQTDEQEFLDFFLEQEPNSVFFEEIPRLARSDSGNIALDVHENKLNILQYFIASMNIMSKCKNIICTSGNCEMWVMLFRGNADGVYQYLNHKEYVYGNKNPNFSVKDNYWLN